MGKQRPASPILRMGTALRVTRADADARLIALLNAALPELELVIGRLQKDHVLSLHDALVMGEAKRLLEEAAGRLLVRVNNSE